MSLIVDETNRYFEHTSQKVCLSPFSRMQRWKDTSISELYVFLGLTLLIPLAKRHDIYDYWKKDSLTYIDTFGKFISRDRYLLLLRFLHFCNNETQDKNDPLAKIRPVFEKLKATFQEYYVPFQNIVIDESLVLFKGRVSFKQYIPTKRHRFGLKLFVLCDCESNIILDIIVYTGKNTDIDAKDPLGISGAIVKKMMSKYLGQNHILYTDNWYTSPSLTQYLHEHDTGSCGTVKQRRKFMPKFVTTKTKGDVQLKKNDTMVAMQWHDKRDVTMISTLHKGNMVDSGKKDYKTNEPIMKPDMVLDYTLNMRQVDQSDSQIGDVECLRKSLKWYKKLFFHLLDICMFNAYNLYLVNTGEHVLLKDFCHDVVYQILEKYGSVSQSQFRASPNVGHLPDLLACQDYMSRHFLTLLPKTQSEKTGYRYCTVCAHTCKRQQKKVKTRWMCAECQAPLCVENCMKEYHIMKHY